MDNKCFKSIMVTLMFLLIYATAFLPVAILGADEVFSASDYYNASTFNTKYKSGENFLCPEDCHCTLPVKNHKTAAFGTMIRQTFLHAKCSSLDGLMKGETIKATLPIHSIDLSYLNLTRLPSQVLEKLTYLTSIDLSHNELHEIGHLGRRIKKLNLKHNRFTSQKLMKLPPNIQVLNLQHNDITRLPLELMKLTQLHSLELSQNHINCTCETLTVRNWLQDRNVFMEQPVICSYPNTVKGKSWLQLKQSLICEHEKQQHAWGGKEFEENELMLGDQPFIEDSGNSGDGNAEGSGEQPIIDSSDDGNGNGNDSYNQDHDDPNEELKKDFIPLSKPLGKELIILDDANEIEGSGSGFNDENNDLIGDGSGSGDGGIIFPISNIILVTTDNYDRDEENNELSPISADIFKVNMGIFEKESNTLDTATEDLKDRHHNNNDDNDPNHKDALLLPIVPSSAVTPTQGPNSFEDELENSIELVNADSIKDANLAHRDGNQNDDSPATYFLLGVIAFILLSMVAYASIKRCKQRRSRRLHNYANGNDVERAQRELVDMDREHLGKQLRNGIPEHVPLMKKNSIKPDDSAVDVKDGHDRDRDQKQPLLNGSGTPNVITHQPLPFNKSESEFQLQDPHEYYPISPLYPTPQSPRASKYGGSVGGQVIPFGTPAPEPNNNIDKDTTDMPPKSPKSTGRYSPVYSPETGRVKIKLTEMPKPKTPMIVTRSRSNAGDIIMTQLRTEQDHHNSNNNNAPIHISVTNGHANVH